MSVDAVEMTKKLIGIPSESRQSNVAIVEYLKEILQAVGFFVECLETTDENQQRKISLVARLGRGTGGLAFCAHSDTVPGQEDDWPAFKAKETNGRIYGRGSCDMKGPLAAIIEAVAAIDPKELKRPIFIVITSDEETSFMGAKQVVTESQLLKTGRLQFGIIAEPTQLKPVYTHKCIYKIQVTAFGKAGHTSTDLGRSANFRIAPFLAEMATLARQLEQEPSYQNPIFMPPTYGFNMVISDGNCAVNVTAPKSTCIITYRAMPDTPNKQLLNHILHIAKKKSP